jgi:hypothetical protein
VIPPPCVSWLSLSVVGSPCLSTHRSKIVLWEINCTEHSSSSRVWTSHSLLCCWQIRGDKGSTSCSHYSRFSCSCPVWLCAMGGACWSRIRNNPKYQIRHLWWDNFLLFHHPSPFLSLTLRLGLEYEYSLTLQKIRSGFDHALSLPVELDYRSAEMKALELRKVNDKLVAKQKIQVPCPNGHSHLLPISS